MDIDALLGGKYDRRNTTPSVPTETDGEGLGDVEAGESKPEVKPVNQPRTGSPRKPRSNPGTKGKS